MPKFVDDLVALAIGNDFNDISHSLQDSTDQLMLWANKEGMQINVEITTEMLFGDSCDKVDKLTVNICGQVLENVTCYKYLGVQLDQQLCFHVQTDCAIAKAKELWLRFVV